MVLEEMLGGVHRVLGLLEALLGHYQQHCCPEVVGELGVVLEDMLGLVDRVLGLLEELLGHH